MMYINKCIILLWCWYIWVFVSCPNKCPFWPLRVEVLKREIQNIEKLGCEHYALVLYFLV